MNHHDAERFRRALENLTQIDDYTDASAAADYAAEVLAGADPDKNEDGSHRAWWIRTSPSGGERGKP